MNATPVLVVTENASLWQRLKELSQYDWQPVRGLSLQDALNWQQQGHQMLIWDMQSALQSSWSEEGCAQTLQQLRALVLSKQLSDEEGKKVLAKGACGYAHAHLPAESIAVILKSLQDGAIWMGRSLLQQLLQDIDQRLPKKEGSMEWAVGLSTREQEVSRWAALGRSNQEIAQDLGITERTVRAHLSAVFDKMQVSDRLQLALKVHGVK